MLFALLYALNGPFQSLESPSLHSITDVKFKGDYVHGQLNSNFAVSGKGVLSAAGVFGFNGYRFELLC